MEERTVSSGRGRPGRADGQGGLSRTGPAHLGRRTGPLLLDRSGAKPEAGGSPSPLDGGVGFSPGLAKEFPEISRTGHRRSGQSVSVGTDRLKFASAPETKQSSPSGPPSARMSI